MITTYIYSLQGFPKCISSSVNNVAAHGIPDSRALEEGDILNIDVTVYHEVEINVDEHEHYWSQYHFPSFDQGYHGDVSDTFTVGKVDNHADKLIR